jgi:DNA repair protein RecN (Recombination protein N)
MLSELKIKNLAVVEDAVIPFTDGLNVLTGSTGAGKSIILSAVDLLSGSKAKRTMIRRGADTITVEGTFRIFQHAGIREKLGMEHDDEMLAIKREFSAGGKSRIWINGMLSTNTMAREITGCIFELHGQHRQQELLDPATHISYLDAWGGYGDRLAECAERVDAYRRLGERLARLRTEQQRHREQEDYYRFQLAELEKLRLKPGLDEELGTRIRLAQNKHRFTDALQACRSLLEEGEGAVLDQLNRLEEHFEFLQSLDASRERTRREIGDFRIAMQELLRDIERELSDEDRETEDIEQLQARLAAIQRVARKHGLDCDGLIARREELRRILRDLTDGSHEIVDMERRVEEAREHLVPVCQEISEKRRRCAANLDREVTAELKRLGMKGALFRTSVERIGNNSSPGAADTIHLTPRGWDTVEFRIRTNVGEDMHPLGDVASGGELSRITLVLKKLQVEEKSIPTLIFDEIDAGLGADLGELVAERMHELSRRYQIICITHLPQIAARAARHIRIDKQVRGGRTVTTASAIDGDERVDEISRMLGGAGGLREKLAAELLQTGKGARSSDG